jgi:hypothetical protein
MIKDGGIARVPAKKLNQYTRPQKSTNLIQMISCHTCNPFWVDRGCYYINDSGSSREMSCLSELKKGTTTVTYLQGWDNLASEFQIESLITQVIWKDCQIRD